MLLERGKIAVILLSVLLAACPAAFAGAPAARGEALVVLKNGLADPLTEEALASVEGRIYVAEVAHGVGARVVNVYGSLSAAGGTVFALFASDKQTTEQLIEALKKRPEVLAASPNHEMRVMGKPKGSGSVSADKKVQEPKNHEVHAVEKPKGSGSVSADKKVQEPKNHEVHAVEKPKGSGSVSADKKVQEPKDHEVHAVEKPKGDGAVSADKKVQEPKSQAKKRKAPAKPKPKK